MPRIEIDVDHILTCAVEIEAGPGDQLLVMNGVVIGMVERRRRQPEPPPVAAVVQPPIVRAKGTRYPEGAELDIKILDLLRHSGPLTTRKIGDRLDLNDRRPLTNAIRKLCIHQRIEAAEEARVPRYRLWEKTVT